MQGPASGSALLHSPGQVASPISSKFTDNMHASSVSDGFQDDPADEEEEADYGADFRDSAARVEIFLVLWLLLAVVVAVGTNVGVGGERGIVQQQHQQRAGTSLAEMMLVACCTFCRT
jgi:hypothetical protein